MVSAKFRIFSSRKVAWFLHCAPRPFCALQVLVARFFLFVATSRLAFCFRICVVRAKFRCGFRLARSRGFACAALPASTCKRLFRILVCGQFARFSLRPRFRVFGAARVLAVLFAASTCGGYNLNSKAARRSNCAPTRRCTRPPTAPFAAFRSQARYTSLIPLPAAGELVVLLLRAT